MKLRLFIVALALLAAGCVATGPAFKEAADGAEGYARLYIYRPSATSGAVGWPRVRINDTHVVDLKAGGYTYVYLKPGVYRVSGGQVVLGSEESTKPEFNYLATINLPEMGNYFLKYEFQKTGNSQRITFVGGNAVAYSEAEGAFKWVSVSAASGLSEIKCCRYLEPNVRRIE